jgi:hypothetical protein
MIILFIQVDFEVTVKVGWDKLLKHENYHQ